MSPQLISRSPDLKRLRDEGYDIEVKSGFLLVRDVPYVSSSKEVKRGMLVSNLTLAGNVTTRPDPHVAYFVGEYPHDAEGRPIEKMRLPSSRQVIANEVVVDHSFSSKPSSGYYENYYEKMTTYVAILCSEAQAIDPTVTAKTFPVIEPKDEDTVFNYIDTASSRAEIVLATNKLAVDKIAIVGLGGTGAYVLDLVAKTPVKQIHLFDGDTFSQHNAFRSPGAATLDDLRAKPMKATHFQELYSKMHRGVVAHDVYVDSGNVAELEGMGFVFLCLDKGAARRLIVERLVDLGIPFVDAGMGVDIRDGNSLGGIIRVTASTPQKHDHVRGRIPFSDGDGPNEYARNIQIADLNALNASLAVIKWKKILGFYCDLDGEHNSAYTIDGNHLTNEDYRETPDATAA